MLKKMLWLLLLILIALVVFYNCFLKIKYTSYVKVKGSSEKNVMADKVYWNIKYTNTGNNLGEIQEKNKKDLGIIKNFLLNNKLDENDFKVGLLELVDMEAKEYKDPNQINRYILTQNIYIDTNKLDLIDKINESTGVLIKENISLKSNYGENQPIYIFTRLNEIKEEMIAEATRNARKSAEQFAKDSNTKIWKIKMADQGIFTILPKNKAEHSESKSKEKLIRVVSTIEYWLH